LFLGVAAVAALALPADAPAHPGAYPETVGVYFQPGSAQRIMIETTFGLILSDDDGQTWRWTCEESTGVGTTFDPNYAISATGTIFVADISGLGISRDAACSFAPHGAPLAGRFTTDVSVGPGGAVWVTTAQGAQNDVFVSRDDGMTFTPTGLAVDRAWWWSVRAAPSDAARVYVAGYQLDDTMVDGGDGIAAPLLYRTDDAAAVTPTWTPLAIDTMGEPLLTILGVSPVDPDVVYLRVDGLLADVLYRSEDAGQTFTPVLTINGDGADLLGFAISNDGQKLLAGTKAHGVFSSTDGGKTWAPEATVLRMACAGRRPADDALFACGANWNPDRMALARSADDGKSWTKIFRFIEIDDELSCPMSSEHAQVCSPLWGGVACGFGIGKFDAGVVDGGPGADAFMVDPPPDDDCGCSVAPAAVLLAWPGFWRRRRRRRVRSGL
jgi:photosystem II stability/assembly factor-like uncharacterized protein